jgi:NADPH:quinone reductase-like Zn-dependent oxidoreductase
MRSNGEQAATVGVASPAPRETTMRAVVQDTYGSADMLRLTQVAAPEVADDDVLVRVRAAPFVSHRLRMVVATTKAADLQILTEFIEADQVAPVIDRTYPLSQVPDAIRHMHAGHARGKVVITV